MPLSRGVCESDLTIPKRMRLGNVRFQANNPGNRNGPLRNSFSGKMFGRCCAALPSLVQRSSGEPISNAALPSVHTINRI